jgi:hypothetical protein
MDGDREEAGSMTSDWTTPEYLANISAEELSRALDMHGIQTHNVGADEDGVTVALAGLRAAETLLTLVLDGPAGPGTLYDRATGSCVTLSNLDDDATDGGVARAFDAGWTWMIHPTMDGRVVGWHVHLTLPAADADQLTGRLNELKRGYAV